MKRNKTTEEFIAEARLVHGDRYDYSKTIYKNWREKICIICPEHGEFWQIPQSHLKGFGCKKCSNRLKSEKMTFGKNEFIKRAKIVHGDTYDYSKVVYEKYNKRVNIICKEHGNFYQTPKSHLQGHGCPYCNNSKLEKYIESILKCNGIKFERQKKFEWLGRKSLDFYLPDYNIAIECQGEQHYKSVEHFGGDEFYNKTIERDIIKNKLCKLNNVKLLYYSDKRNSFLNEKIIDKNNLLKIIKK